MRWIALGIAHVLRAAIEILDAIDDERRWSKRFDWKDHRGH